MIEKRQMGYLYVRKASFYFVTVFVCSATLDHDSFLQQARLHELGIQISLMHEKLYETCPSVFHTPNSGSLPIIGRRRSSDKRMDLKIGLAEETLKDLILTYGNCSNVHVTPWTTRIFKDTTTLMVSTEHDTSSTKIKPFHSTTKPLPTTRTKTSLTTTQTFPTTTQTFPATTRTFPTTTKTFLTSRKTALTTTRHLGKCEHIHV